MLIRPAGSGGRRRKRPEWNDARKTGERETVKGIVKFRWLVFAAWIAALAVLLLTAPNLTHLVREKGDIRLPEGYPSVRAHELMDELKESHGEDGGLTAVLVFHDGEGLSPEDMEEVRRGVEALRNSVEAGVTSVVSHFDQPEMADLLTSEDGKTVLAMVTVDPGDREPMDVRNGLYAALDGISVDHYYTGGWLIDLDVIESAETGTRRTEGITIVFILVILLAVFRSAVAPLVPLLTVGVSYLASQAVVAFLAEYADFPLSTFTQTFLVAVLFGIGTDYCILIISRFREELGRSGNRAEAVVATYRTAGKTVFVAGLAVFIGFAAIGLSQFSLYQSAVAVAVGIVMLLVAIFTLVPFFLATLGKAVFWPFKGSLEHAESRLWDAVGRFSLRRPLGALLIVALIAAPLLLAYRATPTYNSLEEIGDHYHSVRAFNLIAESFGPGESLPATVAIRTEAPKDTAEGLAFLERAARELSEVEGVKSVRGPTRPLGEAPDEFRVARQAEMLGDGLGEGEEGLGQIADGLSQAGREIEANAPQLAEAVDGARKLAEGTEELEKGIARVGDALHRLEQGLREGSAGAAELHAGLAQARDGAVQLAEASGQLVENYRKMENGLGQLSGAYAEIAQKLGELASGLAELERGLGGLALKYPELQSDPDFLRAQGAAAALREGAAGLEGGLQTLQAQLEGVAAGLKQANDGLAQASQSQAELAAGLGQLADGLAALQSGIEQAAEGQGQLAAGLPELAEGARQIGAGQRELADGIAEMSGQLDQLTEGLRQSADGLTRLKEGLAEAQGYLDGLSGAPDAQLAGWFVPEEALENDDFRWALDQYLSGDRKIATLDVVFAGNPYDVETLDRVDDLVAAVERAARDTPYADAEVAVGGVTGIYHDLKTISAEDYQRTVTVMLIGIGLILLVLFRSVIIPVYLLVSLFITYFTSVAFAEALFVRLIGHSGLNWSVPFFSFVMLIALGVDYSIFLMDRFREYRHLPPAEAILKAMRHTGTVIMSAAVILGGTFAAMMPSGVQTLLHIAAVVIFGLMMYALIMMPLFIPMMVRLFGEFNWWPSRRAGLPGGGDYRQDAPAKPAHGA